MESRLYETVKLYWKSVVVIARLLQCHYLDLNLLSTFEIISPFFVCLVCSLARSIINGHKITSFEGDNGTVNKVHSLNKYSFFGIVFTFWSEMRGCRAFVFKGAFYSFGLFPALHDMSLWRLRTKKQVDKHWKFFVLVLAGNWTWEKN